MTLTSNFDKFNNEKSGKTASGQQADDESVTNYAAPGQTRNLCFVQLDGRRKFLNYAYLVFGDYSPGENEIILSFTSHTVTMKGQHLLSLYESLQSQIPKQIACTDKRYLATEDVSKPIVTSILIVESLSA